MRPGHDRHLRAIVFSDVVDSSAKIFADELIAVQQIKDDLALIKEQLQRHGGSLVKSLGDGLLMTFDAPSHALDFIQDVILRLTAREQRSLAHRFGLHTGEIYADGDDILGQGVHLASRLQTVSPVNGVAFVRSTCELIDARYRSRAISQGDIVLKGLPQPMEVFTLSADQLVEGAEVSPVEDVDLAELLSDTVYRIERPIGRSLQQQTWLLRERQRDRQAVLKLIPADQQLVEALKLEVATLDRLRHPRIPRIIDAYDRDGRFCLIQEYIPGASLDGSLDLLRRKQRIGELLRQLLNLLTVVHAGGLVHGDIHPANLIPASDGSALFLVDFSLLRARIEARRAQSDDGEASLSEMGRPYFSAPERARFGRLTASSDLYSLGLSALTLYTGQSPQALVDQSRGGWSFEGVDPEVVRWLEPLLQESPEHRLQHAADALRLLDQSCSAVPAAVPMDAAVKTLGLSKERLQNQLISTYGPVVDLLLESQPTQIPADQVPALVERLVRAGLRQEDLDEAVKAAELSPPAAGSPDRDAGTTPSVWSESDAAALAPRVLLQQVIGPIAELLWTESLTAAWRQGPDQLRSALVTAGVASESIDEFLLLVAQVQGPATDQAGPAVEQDQLTPDVNLQGRLNALVGPIGNQLLQELDPLPAEQRRSHLLERLRALGVGEEVLQEFR